MQGFDRITIDPQILGGQACIRGMRIPVSLILNLLANGKRFDDILTEYHDLVEEDIKQALGYGVKEINAKREIDTRLSSDYLFHYTADIDKLENILRIGFQYRMNDEIFPIEVLNAKIFMICFCDIKSKEAQFHRTHYGNYAVVLTKEWGIKNRVTPVQYIHSNSIPKSEDYWEFALFKDAIIEMANGSDRFVLSVLINSLLVDDLTKKHPITEQEYFNKKSNYEKEIATVLNSFNQEQKQAFAKYITILFNRLITFNNCLERRNVYLKSYRGTLTRKDKEIPNVVFYDEREWRAVEFITTKNQMDDPNFYDTAIREGKLPDKANLKFTDNDVVAILVEKKEQVQEIAKYIREYQPLWDYNKTLEKIIPIDKFAENQD